MLQSKVSQIHVSHIHVHVLVVNVIKKVTELLKEQNS